MTKEYWQDDHIEEVEDGFICYNECGMYLTKTTTIEQAREQLEIYDQYVLNNITD